MVDQLSMEKMILGICETWIKNSDDHLTEALDGSTEAPPIEGMNGDYRGVGIILNPIVRYTIIDRFSTSRIQSIPARVSEIVVSVIYVSPGATARQETLALCRLQKISRKRPSLCVTSMPDIMHGILEASQGDYA